MIEIPAYEKEEYLNSTSPFEWLYSHRGNRLELKQLCNRMAEAALKVGIRNFVALYNEYVSSLQGTGVSGVENQTDFSGQEQGLWCGSWTADDGGIYGTDRLGFEVCACSHPILPVRRLVNIDTGLEKVELSYCRGGIWRRHVYDKSTISDTRAIVKLSDFGIAVNSDNAKHLVRFLGDVESLNYDRIEAVNSIGRLGWIDGYGFSPYEENLVFEGADQYKDFFENVREHGSYDAWLDACRSFRKDEGVPTRVILAASFASVLVKPCGALPFFLHLWGGSEVGKTVGLKLASSVWANPELGRFMQSFNATSVGKELGAAFYNSLPLVLDELQIKDGSPGVRLKFQQMIYELAEGIGRVRGKKTGGLQKIGTWRNCILSSGENPLIESNTAAGAANRTIEIHCQDVKLFEHNCIGDGKAVSIFLERNYGFAGKVFVKKLQQAGSLEKAMQLHDHFISEITSRSDVTDKQASSAALILAADSLMEEWIFQDGIHLEAGNLIPFLVTKAKLDQNQRALEFLHDQIAMNPVHFDPEQARDRSTEIWGDADDNYIYIIKAQFDKLLNDNGFNAENFIPWARQNGVIRIGKDGKSTVKHRILGKDTRCIWLSVASNRGAAEDDYGEDYYAPL